MAKYQLIKTRGAPVFPDWCPVCGSTDDLNRIEMEHEARFLASHTVQSVTMDVDVYNVAKIGWTYKFCNKCVKLWNESREPKLTRAQNLSLMVLALVGIFLSVFASYQVTLNDKVKTADLIAAGQFDQTSPWDRWALESPKGFVITVVIFSVFFVFLGVLPLCFGVSEVLTRVQRKRFFDANPGLRELFKRNGTPIPGHSDCGVRFDGVEKYLVNLPPACDQRTSAMLLSTAASQGQFVVLWQIQNPQYAEAFKQQNSAILS
ncbi:MAG TPA: hypothetical protein PLD92_09630 [Candidatus Omnitrophota bacterium]|jgi:hypothetical protein|nr:hypothetical protein [Candidatus Omnitrophota bacterium]